MAKDIKKRDGESWKKETYYFYCPVCEKPHNIKYDASTRKSFDGKYEDDTCFIKTGKCTFCKTKVYVAYDAEQQGVVAYDIKEEDRWEKCLSKLNDELNKLKKVKKQYKADPSDKLKKKKDALKKKCQKLEKEIIDSDNQYEAACLEEMISREIEESAKF